MRSTLIVTVIGPDRPGLVQSLAATINKHEGNWLESRMCRLGGQFAGILRVEVDDNRLTALNRAVLDMAATGMRVQTQEEPGVTVSPEGLLASLDVVGQDQPGILRRVTSVLSGHGLNIEDLYSECTEAPMGGGNIFTARATLRVPATVTLETVHKDIEAIGPDLMVTIRPLPATS